MTRQMNLAVDSEHPTSLGLQSHHPSCHHGPCHLHAEFPQTWAGSPLSRYDPSVSLHIHRWGDHISDGTGIQRRQKKKIEIKNKNTFEYHQTQLRGKCIWYRDEHTGYRRDRSLRLRTWSSSGNSLHMPGSQSAISRRDRSIHVPVGFSTWRPFP
jgi:hypothetical protein